MHPAPSIIAFTTLSGLGFGLLIWLGIDPDPPTGWVAFVFFALAYAMACGGLMASAGHLGRPERALKAFSQWRTSWLSREAWAAVSALVVMGLYAAALVFFGLHLTLLGWLGAALSLGTVFTTSMIYTQLTTIPRWNHPTTPVMFLAYALAGGALLSGRVSVAIVLLIATALIQAYIWWDGDTRLARSGTTLATATGLQGGQVRAFEPPHTGTNYLTREMVFVVGRRHGTKLRIIAILLGMALPVLFLLMPLAGHVFAGLAVLCHLAGVAVARWLFFAQAEHVVGLYYGKR